MLYIYLLVKYIILCQDELAGCIPRTAANIFDEIGSMDVVDYNVRVSFLELYNEEVRDLLSEDERPPPLK